MNVLLPPPQQGQTAQPDTVQRFLLHDVSWESYLKIADALPDRSGLRITYDQGDLEFMSLSFFHERSKTLLRLFIYVLAEELNVVIMGLGSTTHRRELVQRGLEPDECYYTRSWNKIQGLKALDLDVYPPADLAIEVEISRSALDRMGIYAALGVPEVWRFDGQNLRVCILGTDRQYHEQPRSPTFPAIDPRELVRLVQESLTEDDLAAVRNCRAWVRQLLHPTNGTNQGTQTE